MILVTDPDPMFRDRVRTLLAGVEDSVEEGSGLDDLLVRVGSGPLVVLLGPGIDQGLALDTITQVNANGQERVGAIMFVESLDSGLLRSALRSGFADVLTHDVDAAELAEAVSRAWPKSAPAAPASGDGDDDDRIATVVTVFSTKGGSGKSLVATNLAVMLAEDRDVVLVDLSMQSGDCAIMLQMLARHTFAEAAENVDRLDAAALDAYLATHETGLKLLAAPHDPALAEMISGAAVTKIIQMLQSRHDVVVIDAPPFFNDHVLAAMDLTDQIILLGSMDVPSVKNLRMALTTLQQLGHGRQRVITVLNRADSNVGLRVQEIEKSLDTKIDVQIPSSRAVPTSINRGMPLAQDQPRSPVVEAIGQIIPKIGADTAEKPKSKSRFGWMR